MTITLTREEAQQVLDALYGVIAYDYHGKPLDEKDVECDKAADIIEARLAQPDPEPVADKYLMEVECTKCGAKQDGILTVTAPPQREFIGLTDEELNEIYNQDGLIYKPLKFYRAIEAKLKEKNDG
jgi:hypothetical protein